MSQPAQKCENYAIFKQNYTPEWLIALKMVYSCFFGLRANLDFLDFLQKSFITSIPARTEGLTTWKVCEYSQTLLRSDQTSFCVATPLKSCYYYIA